MKVEKLYIGAAAGREELKTRTACSGGGRGWYKFL